MSASKPQLSSSLQALLRKRAPPPPPASNDPLDVIISQAKRPAPLPQTTTATTATTTKPSSSSTIPVPASSLVQLDPITPTPTATQPEQFLNLDDDIPRVIPSTTSQSKANRHLQQQQQQGQLCDLSNTPASRKIISWRQTNLQDMTERDWRNFREEFQLTVHGTDVPRPLRFWHELKQYGIPPSIFQALENAGYTDPTPIQRMALPVSLSNRDVIARAETGSGKTCSFLIPVLSWLSKQQHVTAKTAANGPHALILAPVRELALQIYDEALKFVQMFPHHSRPGIACIIGGADVAEQSHRLHQGVDMIIATPGRFIDVLNEHIIVLSQCKYLILDEADRMLDEGFEVQVKQILDYMPSAQQSDSHQDGPTTNTNNNSNEVLSSSFGFPTLNTTPELAAYRNAGRRTMLYSATFTPKVEKLARDYMQPNAVKIEAGHTKHRINKNISQYIIWCATIQQRRHKVIDWLNKYPGKVIIFCAQKAHCDDLASFLNYSNSKSRFSHDISAVALHGDASDRERVLAGFRDNKYNTLVATDVAGRGIDVKNVRLVINYELPIVSASAIAAASASSSNNNHNNNRPQKHSNPFQMVFEAYTHRVGRTGRGVDTTGSAVTFVGPTDSQLIPSFKTFLASNGVANFPREFDSFKNADDAFL